MREGIGKKTLSKEGGIPSFPSSRSLPSHSIPFLWDLATCTSLLYCHPLIQHWLHILLSSLLPLVGPCCIIIPSRYNPRLNLRREEQAIVMIYVWGRREFSQAQGGSFSQRKGGLVARIHKRGGSKLSKGGEREQDTFALTSPLCGLGPTTT